jgi:hypothetical protein
LVLDKHKCDTIKNPRLVHAYTSVCRLDERAALSQSYRRPGPASIRSIDTQASLSVKWCSYNQTTVVLILMEGESSCNLLLPALIGTQGGGVKAVLQCCGLLLLLHLSPTHDILAPGSDDNAASFVSLLILVKISTFSVCSSSA